MSSGERVLFGSFIERVWLVKILKLKKRKTSHKTEAGNYVKGFMSKIKGGTADYR